MGLVLATRWLPLAVGFDVGDHGDYGRNWHGPPDLAHLQARGDQTGTWPAAGERQVWKRADPSVNGAPRLAIG
jgi:hypothetical protein